MPVVPRIERSIEPQGIPNARLNPSMPSSAFGGMEHTQAATIDIAEKYYENEKRRLDQAVLLDADLQLSTLSTQLDLEASSYKGKDAHQALDIVKSSYQKAVKDIDGTLSNDEQRLAFKNRAMAHWVSLNDRINKYVANETDKYTEDTTKAWIINKVNLSKQNYNDPKALNDSLTEIKAVLTDFYTSHGRGDNEIEVDFENIKAKLYESAKKGFMENLSAMITDGSPRIADVYKALKETKDGKYVNYSILDTKERETAINDIESWVKELDKRKKEEDKKNQDATGSLFLSKLIDGTLTKTEILQSNLSSTGENSKEHWVNQIDEYRKKDTFKTDKDKEAELYRRIQLDPVSISDDEISSAAGVYLTIEDSRALLADKNRRINELSGKDYKTDNKLEASLFRNIVANPRKMSESDITKHIGKGLSTSDANALLRERDRRIKEPEAFKTDKAVEADLYSRIITNPESVKDEEITSKIGKSLTKDDAKSLIDERKARIGKSDPLKTQQAITAIAVLDNARTQKLFNSDDKADNERQWSEYSLMLRDFIKNHPDDDPVAFVNDDIMKPVVTSWTESILDWTSFGTPGKDAAIQKKKGRIKTLSESPIHPLQGKPAGKYKVDGKIMKWDGTKEIP